MPTLADNPFAVLTAVVAPAVLTNASSVLSLGTANRMGRIVDRTRMLSAELRQLEPHDRRRQSYVQQLARLKQRADLALRALRFFYASIGSFAAAALISVFGAVISTSAPHAAFVAIAALGLISGTVGVAGLVAGCTAMVHETRLAVRNLAEEAALEPSTDSAAEAP
jgi:hypothetical protein